jgi:hypothetical protein
MPKYFKYEDFCKEVDKSDLLIGNNAEWAKEIAERTPQADVAEVIHAKWMTQIWDGNDWISVPYATHKYGIGPYCSACNGNALLNGAEESVASMFCPHCGAIMDG